MNKLENQSKTMEENFKKNSKTLGESKEYGQMSAVIIN